MKFFLDVSFPVSMGRDSFTYHAELPEEEVPRPGTRVIVPVHGRKSLGYVTSAHHTDPGMKTLPVTEFLDPTPLLDQALVELGFWIASTCLCSPGEAFHGMIPGGVKQNLRRMVSAVEGPALDAAAEGAEDARNALFWLLEKRSATLKGFLDAFPRIRRNLPGWEKSGIIRTAVELGEGGGPRLRRVVVLDPDRPLPVGGLTPKEKRVVEYLLKANLAEVPARICARTGVSMSPIQGLIRKGILEVREERVMREVAGEDYYQAVAAPVFPLSPDQERALVAIRTAAQADRKPVLIRGVTCSGKTEIYLRWVGEVIGNGRSAIVMVPEISLTPQMVKRFRDRFGSRVAILHSKLSEGERFDQWESLRQGTCPVVVGARSAVFAPVRNLGTIILDEEGEPSFKQGEVPRYHARTVAEERCRIENALLVMGSATPTMDAFQTARNGGFNLVELPTRISARPLPRIQVVDMRKELVAKGNRSIFSEPLSRGVRETLRAGKQAILFLNRRGHSSFVLCRACGETIGCSRCQVSLVFHSGSQILRCHYCGEAREVPTVCPGCGSTAIRFFGAGTQRVEMEARRYFPEARIGRLDSDVVGPRGSLEKILDKFGRGALNLLIGTQMVAKGLDFPNVTLVGILAADSLLRIPDFRASERNFSLLSQVSGRAGRGDTPGNVVLQTYFPEHHSIRFALHEDYTGFFEEESKNRRALGFPPFGHIAAFLLSSELAERARAAGEALKKALGKSGKLGPDAVLGPSPAPIEKIQSRYRFQVLVRCPDLGLLQPACREALHTIHAPGVRIAVDIDPYFSL